MHLRPLGLLLSLLAITSGLHAAPPKPVKSERPNIIFIVADDLGYGDLGCYGQTLMQTPHLDQMAREGLRFTDAYAGAPVCSPSRSVLMSGLHTGHARHRANYGYDDGKRPRIGFTAGQQTLASVLKGAGYTTALFGKWHLGGSDAENNSARQLGFDVVISSEIDSLKEQRLGSEQEDEASTREALKFISAKHENPFFIYLAYHAPHAPLKAPTLGPYQSRDWPAVEKNYAAIVHLLDQRVGDILARLRELDLGRNTLVIFTSDNGAHTEGGHDEKFFKSAGPFRGIKRDLYEGGIRVPFIAWWPGRTDAGAVTDHTCAFWDLLPTFAELAGAKITQNYDGISFAPTLRNWPTTQELHPFLYWEGHEPAFRQAVRVGAWKMVRQIDNAPIEVYNLKDDPGETNNLATARPDMVATAQLLFQSARNRNPYWPVDGYVKP